MNKPSQLDHSPEGAAVNLGPYFPSCSAAHFVVIQASKEPRAQKNSPKNSAGGRADRFGVGARTLERSFAAETGLSLGRWRRQARFLHALRRLGAGAPVKQAALDAGYQSPSAFIAAFRAALDTTPGRYFQAGRP